MIETTLDRIADALESIADMQERMLASTGVATEAVVDKPVLKAAEKVTKPPPAEKKTAVPPPANLTVAEVNAALMVEYARLDNDFKKISDLMAAEPFCVTIIDDLSAEKFGDLVKAVKELQ